jgi:hypothetical protein
MRRRDVRLILQLLAAVITAALGTLVVEDGSIPEGSPATPQTRVVEKPLQPEDVPVPEAVAVIDGQEAQTQDPEPNRVLELDDEAQEVAALAATNDNLDVYAEGDELRGEDDTPVAQFTGPLATPHVPGCRTRILPANWSERVTSVRGFGLHYTAGLNREGWSDMDGLTAYASSSAAGVSWHFLIDAEGHCYYSVPLLKKAWTIGNLNSQTVNVEVIGTGQESTYPAGDAGLRKLRTVTQFVAREFGFPVRVGSVSGCNITSPGVITHWQGGSCAGGHTDIRPYDLAQVVRALAQPARVKISDRDRGDCKAIVRYRQRRHGKDKAARQAARKPKNERRQRERVKRVRERGLYCTSAQNGAKPKHK